MPWFDDNKFAFSNMNVCGFATKSRWHTGTCRCYIFDTWSVWWGYCFVTPLFCISETYISFSSNSAIAVWVMYLYSFLFLTDLPGHEGESCTTHCCYFKCLWVWVWFFLACPFPSFRWSYMSCREMWPSFILIKWYF